MISTIKESINYTSDIDNKYVCFIKNIIKNKYLEKEKMKVEYNFYMEFLNKLDIENYIEKLNSINKNDILKIKRKKELIFDLYKKQKYFSQLLVDIKNEIFWWDKDKIIKYYVEILVNNNFCKSIDEFWITFS